MSFQKWIFVLIYGITCLGLLAIGNSFFNQIGCEGQLAIASFHPSPFQEIQGGRVIGQSFFAPFNHLNRIEIRFLTYNRQNTQDVIFRLLEPPLGAVNLYEGKELFRTTFNARQVTDRGWYSFDFPAIADSSQKTYFFILESLASEPGNAITVGGVQKDIYQPGTAYFRGEPVPADLTFRTCYQMTSLDKLGILGEQLTRHRPGWWGNSNFYILIIVIYGLLLAGFLWKLTKLEW